MSNNTDYIKVPKKLFENFTEEFLKLRKMYELIDHELAEYDLEKWNIKTFNNVNDFFDELENNNN